MVVSLYKIERPFGAIVDPLSSAVTVLTAMITPAVLISACGSMILSTSSRLGRVVDRVRGLSDRLEEISRAGTNREPDKERQAAIFEQLDKLTSRARLLQRCMVTFYLGLGAFVATSVAIGFAAILGPAHHTLVLAPIIFGIIGALFLFYGSVLLIFEARLALSTIHSEMDFIWGLTKRIAPAEIVDSHKPHFVHFRRRQSHE